MSCLGIFDLLTDIFFVIESFDYGIEENNFGFFWSSLIFTIVPWSLTAICTGIFLSVWRKKLNSNENNNRILKTLIASPKYRTGIELLLLTNMFRYSSMNAIIDMYSSKKQRLQILFDFLTEGPFLPEQNLIEPTSSRLFPWGITYWKRALSGIPLHGSVLDMADTRNIEVCLLNNLRREREFSFSLRKKIFQVRVVSKEGEGRKKKKLWFSFFFNGCYFGTYL